MAIYQSLGLVLLLVAAAILLVRYVNLLVDRDFRNLALAAEDPERRAAELAKLDQLLDGRTPPPPGFKPAPGPLPGLVKALPPIFCLLGTVSLLGSLSDGLENPRWPGIGFLIFAPALLLPAFTLRRRRAERTARLLRHRADLKRLGGDAAAAAADLTESLRLAPWDDSSWAELADDLAGAGESDRALAAIRRAVELDPGYGDHRLLEVSLLLRLGQLEPAAEALRNWREKSREPRFQSLADCADEGGDGERGAYADPDADGDLEDAAFAEYGEDPRILVFQAALDLARGKRDLAAESLDAFDLDDPTLNLVATDPALAGLKDLLPG